MATIKSVYTLQEVNENGCIVLGGAALHVRDIEIIETDFFEISNKEISNKEIQAVKINLKSGQTIYVREKLEMEEPNDEDTYAATVYPAIFDAWMMWNNAFVK